MAQRRARAALPAASVSIDGRGTGEKKACVHCGGVRFAVEVVVPDPDRPGADVACLWCAGCGANVASIASMSIGQQWSGLKTVATSRRRR